MHFTVRGERKDWMVEHIVLHDLSGEALEPEVFVIVLMWMMLLRHRGYIEPHLTPFTWRVMCGFELILAPQSDHPYPQAAYGGVLSTWSVNACFHEHSQSITL